VPASLLAAVTGLPDPDVTRALHALRDRHLLDPRAEDAALTHPLVAEGVRRRLVPGEATRVHALLARHLADREDASPAEVAAHYRAADDPGGELPWRIRAAHEAHGRTAPREEADHWLRALETWPPDTAAAGGVRLARAQLAAVEALDASGQEPVGLTLARSALDTNPHLDQDERFRLALRAAAITWGQHGPDAALQLLDREEARLGDVPAPDLRVSALRLRAGLLSKTGRVDEALGVLDEAVRVSDEVTDHAGLVRLFATRGWHLGFTGDLQAARQSFRRAGEILTEAPSPDGEVFLAMMQTDVLLHHGRPPAECVRAADRALQHIRQLDLRSTMTNIVRANVGEAWVNAGRPHRAAELLLDDVGTGDDYSLWPLRQLAARVAVTGGHLDDALTLLRQPSQDDLFARLTAAVITSEALIWKRRADDACKLLRELLVQTLDNDVATIAGPAFVMLARATADSSAVPREDATAQLHILRDSSRTDPLGPDSMPASRPACAAQWDAETARAAGRDSVETWVRAVAEWEQLGRPHDAAYCRWRAARAALRDGGQSALAARLLTRAASDAREHAPLSAALSGTAAQAAHPRPG
jgi:tetratricopeptide (TPR) repeat protein